MDEVIPVEGVVVGSLFVETAAFLPSLFGKVREGLLLLLLFLLLRQSLRPNLFHAVVFLLLVRTDGFCLLLGGAPLGAPRQGR